MAAPLKLRHVIDLAGKQATERMVQWGNMCAQTDYSPVSLQEDANMHSLSPDTLQQGEIKMHSLSRKFNTFSPDTLQQEGDQQW